MGTFRAFPPRETSPVAKSEEKRMFSQAKNGTIWLCDHNEKCCSVDGGRGICPLFSSPPRGIWQANARGSARREGAGRRWNWLMHKLTCKNAVARIYGSWNTCMYIEWKCTGIALEFLSVLKLQEKSAALSFTLFCICSSQWPYISSRFNSYSRLLVS